MKFWITCWRICLLLFFTPITMASYNCDENLSDYLIINENLSEMEKKARGDGDEAHFYHALITATLYGEGDDLFENNSMLGNLHHKNFSVLLKSCKDYLDQAQESSIVNELKKQCEQEIMSLVEDDNKLQEKLKEGRSKTLEQALNKRMSNFHQSEDFQNLAIIRKFLAQDLLKKCPDFLKDHKDQVYADYLERIACERYVQGSLASEDDFGKFVEYNADVLVALNQKLSQVNPQKVLIACQSIQNSLPDITLSLCASKNDKKASTDVKKRRQQKKSVTSSNDSSRKMKTEHQRRRAASSFSPQKNRGHFWKTAGLVGAAIGGSGLMAWGLTKAFEPMSTSSYQPTFKDYGPRTIYNYHMNPYEMYRYQQFQNNGWYQSPYYMNNVLQAPGMSPTNGPYNFNFTP